MTCQCVLAFLGSSTNDLKQKLDTLELIAKGLNSNVMLIPKEKLSAVLAVLESDGHNTSLQQKQPDHSNEQKALYDDPWKGLLGDDEEDKDGNGN